MTELLPNHFHGIWQTGSGAGTVLHDGSTAALFDTDPAEACWVGPTLLGQL